MEVKDDPVTAIHGFEERDGRMLLADDVAEPGIARERGRFVQNRLPHGRPHGLTRLVVAKLEILPDLNVRELLETAGAKRGVGEERCEFKGRETVLIEDVKGIAEELISSCAQRIEVPALP